MVPKLSLQAFVIASIDLIVTINLLTVNLWMYFRLELKNYWYLWGQIDFQTITKGAIPRKKYGNSNNNINNSTFFPSCMFDATMHSQPPWHARESQIKPYFKSIYLHITYQSVCTFSK